MKKLLVLLLLLLNGGKILAQFSARLNAGVLGSRFLYLRDASDLYRNNNKKEFSPELSVECTIKKFTLTAGAAYTKQSFSLKPGIYWLKPYDSTVGALSYNKSISYRQLHFLLGRTFTIKSNKIHLNLKGGVFFLKQVEEKDDFLGPYSIVHYQKSGFGPARKLFNPKIPGLMLEFNFNYNITKHFSLYTSLSWRGLLDYVTVDELEAPNYDGDKPFLKRNYINLGLGIGYTFIKSKAK